MEQTKLNTISNGNEAACLVEKKHNLSSPLSTSSSGSSAVDAEVRIIGMDEYKPAGDCLAQAFATDEVARYFVDTPDMANISEEQKWKIHTDILRYLVAAHCLRGLVTTCGEDYGAVALWMPPGTNMDGFLTILRSGLWRLYFQLSSEGRHRFFKEFFPLLHDTKSSALGPSADDNSMYLVYVGTKPSARGKGYARKLIEHGLKMADDLGVPTYLESSAQVNVKYYQKFGFVWKKNIVLQRAEKPIELGIMVRDACTNIKAIDGL